MTVCCDYDTLWRFLRRESLSFKKSVAASEQERPDVARRRAAWKWFEARIVPERLVFIDETWTKTNMFRRPWMVPARREASRQGSSWPLENPDLRGGVALRRHRCALRL